MTSPKMRYIPFNQEAGSFNMSTDDYFLRQPDPIVLRFYGWKQPTLSFGKSQQKVSDIDWKFCNSHNFELVRRPSGGKTVFHDQELTYSLICNKELLPVSLLESYRLIGKALLDGLAIADLTMNPEKKRLPNTTNCFWELSSWEIAYKNKKLVGSAQMRTKNKIMQHGSILLSKNKQFWSKIWLHHQDPDQRIISLDEIIKPSPNIKQIQANLVQSIGQIFGAQAVIKPLSAIEIKKIDQNRPHWQLTVDQISN